MTSQADFEFAFKRKNPNTVFGQNFIALPCSCQEGGGPTHWAAIRNSPEAIQDHLDHEQALKAIRDLEDDTDPAHKPQN